MRVFLTGATGFIGGEVVRQLRARGDEVCALVRSPHQSRHGSPHRAAALEAAGVEVVAGDLDDTEAIVKGMADCDAAVHAAAWYEVGIRPADRPTMYDVNVRGTQNVLQAALDAKLGKVVYVSTGAVFGNTHGEVVDEGYQRTRDGYTSYYEETKVLAHDLATDLQCRGLPLVIVLPGVVYGPGDHSQVGNTIEQFLRRRLPAVPFGDMGLNMVYRDDAAAGVLLALDKGRPGESYVLGGETVTLQEVLSRVARLVGRRPPRVRMPTAALRMMTPVAPVLGKLLGLPPYLPELITTSDGVTFWASSQKARDELGYRSRPLDEGLREVVGVR